MLDRHVLHIGGGADPHLIAGGGGDDRFSDGGECGGPGEAIGAGAFGGDMQSGGVGEEGEERDEEEEEGG
ncbi:MAG: hypothetical protein KC931_12270, partial [Candidatus Omnitrophica bacterium]|nr:hypothetical protein [Candidatus Omnitrophota bacterium]